MLLHVFLVLMLHVILLNKLPRLLCRECDSQGTDRTAPLPLQVVMNWERKTPKGGAAIPIAMLVFLILLIGCLALPGLRRGGGRPHAPRPPARTISLPPIKISHESSWHRWPAAPGPSGADSPVAHGVINAESYA